jgi:hypothetical protein
MKYSFNNKVWGYDFLYLIYKVVKEKILFKINICVGKTTSVDKLRKFFVDARPMDVGYSLIRIGGYNDGGYLVPDDFIGIDGCFSPGVADKADFENELTMRGLKCFMADFSVKEPPLKNQLFDFEPRYLGSFTDSIYITLSDWVNWKSPNSKDLILQMDIEGAEYSVLAETDYSVLEKFRIIVIEFHNFNGLINSKNFELINVVFQKLLKKFVVVHVHPNNFSDTTRYKEFIVPSAVEYTLIRKDRIKKLSPVSSFPNKLDQACSPIFSDIKLPNCFYKF